MNNPAPISDIMKSTLKSMNEKLYIKYLRQSVFYDWEKIVGEANARKIQPLYISYKKLYLYAKDSNWRSNIFAYKPMFIQKINDYLGENLIDDILFAPPNQKPKENDDIIVAPAPKNDVSKDLSKINLSDEEIEEIEKSCACIDDEKLRNTVLKSSINHAKLEKYRLKKDWHKCINCDNNLCPPEEKICDVCRRLEQEIFTKKVVDLLNEVPYLTYADIKKEIEYAMPEMLYQCIPERIESIRSMMVQKICQSLDKNDQNQLNFLVMLFKGVKPKDMTPALINKTLHLLRNDILTNGRKV